MPPPRLSFRGDEPSAETRFQNAASDLGLLIVCRIIEQNVLDRFWLVDEESIAPKHLPLDDVALVCFLGVGGDHVVAQRAKKLKQRQARAPRHRRWQHWSACRIVKAAHELKSSAWP